MFTFHWSELLIVAICGLALFFRLAFLMLRRRDEVLEDYLTPEEPDLEEEFFRVRSPKSNETSMENNAEPETVEAADGTVEAVTRWGTSEDT